MDDMVEEPPKAEPTTPLAAAASVVPASAGEARLLTGSRAWKSGRRVSGRDGWRAVRERRVGRGGRGRGKKEDTGASALNALLAMARVRTAVGRKRIIAVVRVKFWWIEWYVCWGVE